MSFTSGVVYICSTLQHRLESTIHLGLPARSYGQKEGKEDIRPS